MNANQEVLQWVDTTLARHLERATKKNTGVNQTEVEHVIDYLCSEDGPKKLRRMSYPQALAKADAWSRAQQKKGKDIEDKEGVDFEVVHDFLDGARIVRLCTKTAYQREGFLMSHCVGGYDVNDKSVHIYSYRDAKNMPHATFEVQYAGTEDASITQIKGKGNGSIHSKYVHPILAFLRTIGMEIRPYDMQHLGYLHVPKEQLEMLRHIEGASEQLVPINGEMYVTAA